MTLKLARQELEALREALTAPVAIHQTSALAEIEARLDLLLERQSEPPGQPTAAEMAGLVAWWQQQFGKELHG